LAGKKIGGTSYKTSGTSYLGRTAHNSVDRSPIALRLPATYNRTMKALRHGMILTALFLVISALATWAVVGPALAGDVLSQAEAQAAAEHKDIFLIFGASWCGWCKKLDNFNQTPEVSAILERNFVITHLTVEEHGDKAVLDNPGAQELMSKLGGAGGLPFFAFLDSEGKLIVSSNRPANGKSGDTNIGFPGDPGEVAWFRAMLNKAVSSLTPEEARLIEDQIHKQLQH
jgi:thioredoxin-related protein